MEPIKLVGVAGPGAVFNTIVLDVLHRDVHAELATDGMLWLEARIRGERILVSRKCYQFDILVFASVPSHLHADYYQSHIHDIAAFHRAFQVVEVASLDDVERFLDVYVRR